MRAISIIILVFFISIKNIYGQFAYELTEKTKPMRLKKLLKRRKNDIHPFKFYEFNTEVQATLKYEKKEGISTIIIPPNALTTQEGKIYKGKVQLIYREIYKMSQIVLLNVSMKTTSGEQLATFGMFEIYAFDDKGNPLQIARGKKITVEMVNTYKPQDNVGLGLYIYDTTRNNWIPLQRQPDITQQPVSSTISRWDWDGGYTRPNINRTQFQTKYKIDIEGFGFYNYDIVLKRPNFNLMAFVKFENLTQEEITQIIVVYKNIRAVVTYYNSYDNIPVIEHTPFLLMAFTKNNKLKTLSQNIASKFVDQANPGNNKKSVILEEYDLKNIDEYQFAELIENLIDG